MTPYEMTRFIAQSARVLRRPGWLFVTTPNGDDVLNQPPNYNPDHRRHYTHEALTQLLSRHFNRVRVTYGIKTRKNRARGLRSLTRSRPSSKPGDRARQRAQPHRIARSGRDKSKNRPALRGRMERLKADAGVRSGRRSRLS